MRNPMIQPSSQLEHSHATASDWFDEGGPGRSGQPSATSVAFEVSGPGGRGQPAPLNVRSIAAGLPAKRLTDRITGSTIDTAKVQTATSITVFFKVVSLLIYKVRRGTFDERLFWKMFRLRNTGGHENAYSVPAKP